VNEVRGPSAGPPQAGPHPLGGSVAVPGDLGAQVTHLLYLHGFRSSPLSTKAQQTAAWMAAHQPDVQWWCPQLMHSPAAAMAQLFDGIRDWPRDGMAVIGSSLGGFYATVIAEALGCPAVLLNPAVDPARDLAGHVGEHTVWQKPEETIVVKPEFADELRAMRPAAITHPERYWLLIAKGDEVLDWREMQARYPGAPGRVLEGGDHALTDYEDHLPELMRFLGLN
jgi:predicted esterase YcpF (UPF0227 family)